MPVPINNQ